MTRRRHTARPAPALPAARRRGAGRWARDQRRPDRRTRCRGRDQDPDPLPGCVQEPEYAGLALPAVPGAARRPRDRGPLRLPAPRHRAGLQHQRRRHRHLRPVRQGAGERRRVPRLVGRRTAALPAQPPLGDAGLSRRSDHARALARHPRPVPDQSAGYAVAGHGHLGARPSRRAGVPGAPRARRRARHRPGLVPGRPAHAQRPLRRPLDPGPARRPGQGQRAGLPRHLRPQHQRGHARLRPRSSPTTSWWSAARR